MSERPTQPFRPTLGHVVATVTIFVAALAVIALFMIPVRSAWFWPVAVLFALSAGLGLLVPLRPR